MACTAIAYSCQRIALFPQKKVLVRLIEPPATFPVCLEVYWEKLAMGKDNHNDSDIMHLFSLAPNHSVFPFGP